MADYVGRWECDNCGTKVWGILRHCPNCGANTTGKFYLPEGEPPTTADEVMRIIRAGANWQCLFCKSDNYGDAPFCTECGGARDGSPTRETHEYGLSDTPRSDAEIQHTGEVEKSADRVNEVSGFSATGYEPPRQKSRFSSASSHMWDEYPQVGVSRFIMPTLIALALFIVAGLIYLVLRPYEVHASIDRFEWTRTVHIDQYRTVREGNWSIPTGGRYVSQEQRVHHYESVFDHYETRTRRVADGSEQYVCGTTDNGNGTFSDRMCSRTTYRTESYQEAVYRQEPRYATWYHYDIDKWVPSRDVGTGNSNRNDPQPYWGEFSLDCNGQAVLGCERESSREEHYYVIFTWLDGDQSKEYRHEEDRGDWDSYDQRGEYTLVLNGLGMLLNDPLRPESENQQ